MDTCLHTSLQALNFRTKEALVLRSEKALALVLVLVSVLLLVLVPKKA